jgi:hypothetical protein
LVQGGQALESARDSGFDLPAAAGEPVDNSYEAKATIIRVETAPYPIEGDSERKVDRIVIADNGMGITPDILANVLSLGFSTRYGRRDGLGRFGMGLKLAALSHARRVEVYTHPHGSKKYFYTCLDLDLVNSSGPDRQEYIEATEVESFPSEYQDLMTDDGGKEFESGTLVIWDNVDRLNEGGKFGSSLQERLQDLTKFLARAYRQFIDKGLRIELNGREITLHDPLFLLDNPRVVQKFPEAKAKILEDTKIEIDGHKVKVMVTLLPEEFRHQRTRGGRSKEFADLYIPDNNGRVSILRNGREIYYDVVPKLFPSGVDDSGIDRFVGVEVSFPATLDEYFQVRNVKRGAEPVSKLREELKKILERPIKEARKEIRSHWDEEEKRKREVAKEHDAAAEAVKRAEETTPRGRAGADMSEAEREQKLNDMFEDLGIDPERDATRAAEIRAVVEELPITLVDGAWPGKELVDIVHLNGKAIVKVNHRHPFIREIYEPVKEAAAKDPSEVDPAELVRLSRKIEGAVDVLLMAYAKAENMHSNPDEAYSELRTDWGKFTAAYVYELLKDL